MNRLQILRKAKGLSQAELGNLLSMSQNTISQYETEKRKMDPDTLSLFSSFFNVSTDYLLGLEEQKNKPAPMPESELTDLQKQAVEFVLSLSNEELKQFIRIGNALKKE